MPKREKKAAGARPTKMPKVGATVTKVALDNRYWRGSWHELERIEYVEQLETRHKERSKFKVLRELPPREELEMEVNSRLYMECLHCTYLGSA